MLQVIPGPPKLAEHNVLIFCEIRVLASCLPIFWVQVRSWGSGLRFRVQGFGVEGFQHQEFGVHGLWRL